MRHAVVSSLLALALLGACAGPPLVAVNAPGFTVGDSAGAPAMTLAQARQHLMRLRATYREAMAQQLAITQSAGAGLVVLGATIAGLAAGHAHPDAIVGASLLGGTAYAVGTLTLDRRRVLAFDAGIKALDCANDAVIPLDLDADARQALRDDGARLAQAQATAADRVATVRALLDDLETAAAIEPGPLAAARKSVAAMDAALGEADKSRKAADRLARDTREIGQRLQGTVNAIAARVDGFIAQTVPDLAAVQQVVAGLGGFASAFAPGAGIDKALASAQQRYDAATTAAPAAKAATPELQARLARLPLALAALDDAAAALIAAAAAVHADIGDADGAAVVAALKACNVTDIALPLAIEPAALALEAPTAAARGFVIRGGTRPYTVQLLDGAVDGLNIEFGGGFADRARIGAAAGVPPATYRVLVSDSAGASLQLPVTVGARAAVSAAAAPRAERGGSGDGRLQALAAALNVLPPLTMAGGTAVAVVAGSAAVDGAAQHVDLGLRCTPARPARKLKAADVLDRLVAAAQLPGWVGQANPLRVRPPNPDCFAG